MPNAVPGRTEPQSHVQFDPDALRFVFNRLWNSCAAFQHRQRQMSENS